MTRGDEHDDDLEPEVIEGAEVETEKYEKALKRRRANATGPRLCSRV